MTRTSTGLIIILASVLFLTNCDKKTLVASCLCDTSNKCDYECCCDNECNSTAPLLVIQWEQYGLCADDTLPIPVCGTNTTQPSIQDLYSGIRTLYTVIKRLFCISQINIVNVDQDYTRTSTNQQRYAITIQSPQIHSSNPITTTILNKYSKVLLPQKNAMGLCKITADIKQGQNINFQQCRVLSSSALNTGSLLRIQTYVNQTTFASIRIMDSKSNGVYNTANSTLTTSCSGTVCTNAVRFVKLIFQGSNFTLSSESYLIVGRLQWNSANLFYTNIGYSYQFIESLGKPTSTNLLTYALGSPLQLVKKVVVTGVGDQYYRIYNPIHLSFRQPNGDCKTTSAQQDASPEIHLQMGKDMVLSCNVGTALSTTPSPFNSISSIFDFVSKIATPKNVGDYLQLNWPTTTILNSLVLNIFYAKVGAQTNPQYAIISASVSTVTPVNNRVSSLYIQFTQVTNNAALYVPPPPIVEAYLPNDFLSPFIVG